MLLLPSLVPLQPWAEPPLLSVAFLLRSVVVVREKQGDADAKGCACRHCVSDDLEPLVLAERWLVEEGHKFLMLGLGLVGYVVSQIVDWAGRHLLLVIPDAVIIVATAIGIGWRVHVARARRRMEEDSARPQTRETCR